MKRMLFNATHSEELRVAIVDGQKLIDIDIETAGREQRKSNIYKGVITRIEPSLEACFINYGEDRHGFLPFKEISKQYFKNSDAGRIKIQDVLSEGQALFVQVEKEERGNKGAALTTFISLAGRYLVLMPNSPRGGGVSRRIEGDERQELREVMNQLDHPKGMSIIGRTAGIGRSAEEMQWDLNYLLQLWAAIDNAGQSANGAFLIYQESSLVIRAIRDYFHQDIGEVLIDTDDIYEQAKQFMQHVMPDMAKLVKRYREHTPLFSRFQIEHQIETAYSRMVPLPSGGAIVIDHTEALVSIDVNSARSTRGADIEDTALRTNLEAAEEVARQLRLRDLGGLIVIDFIDMERAQNQKEVENKIKDNLPLDRARVQMGKISRFGLMELSRQRIRPALSEGSHTTCPRCTGTGVIRDTESSALHVLRIIQEEAMKEGTASVRTQVPVDVATFLLNEKRSEIFNLEARLKVAILLIPNKYFETPHYEVSRIRHDEESPDEPTNSFELVHVTTEQSYYEQKIIGENKKQEPVIKGVLPTVPAPSASRRRVSNKKDTSETSFLSRIVGWFKRDHDNESESKGNSNGSKGSSKAQTQDKTNDTSSKRHSRRRNQNRRPTTAKADADGTTHTKGRPNLDKQNKASEVTTAEPKTTETQDNKDAVKQDAASDDNKESSNKPRRRRRSRRKDQTETCTQNTAERINSESPNGALENKELSEQPNAAPEEAINQDDNSENKPNNGRKRRRGRNNQRNKPLEGQNDHTAVNSAAPTEEKTTIEESGSIKADQPEVTLETATSGLTANPSHANPVTQENTEANSALLAPETEVAETRLPENDTEVVKPDHSQPRAQEATKTSEPREPFKLEKEKLLPILEQAGLNWIETDLQKWQEVQNRLSQIVQAARTPRIRKPAPQIELDNLTLIETRPEFRKRTEEQETTF